MIDLDTDGVFFYSVLTGPPVRRFEIRLDKRVFCGQCELNGTTNTGVKLTKEWDLATLDRSLLKTGIEHELVLCEVCGVPVDTKKHLRWIAESPGAIGLLEPRDLAGDAPVTHGPSPMVFLEMLTRVHSCRPLLLGIQPGCLDPDAALTPPVRAAMVRIAAELQRLAAG